MVEKKCSNFFFLFFCQNTIKGKNDPALHSLLFLEWFWAMCQKKQISCVSPQIIKLMSHVLATGIQAGNTISQSLSCDPVVREEMHTPRTHLSSACCEREQSWSTAESQHCTATFFYPTVSHHPPSWSFLFFLSIFIFFNFFNQYINLLHVSFGISGTCAEADVWVNELRTAFTWFSLVRDEVQKKLSNSFSLLSRVWNAPFTN